MLEHNNIVIIPDELIDTSLINKCEKYFKVPIIDEFVKKKFSGHQNILYRSVKVAGASHQMCDKKYLGKSCALGEKLLKYRQLRSIKLKLKNHTNKLKSGPMLCGVGDT